PACIAPSPSAASRRSASSVSGKSRSAGTRPAERRERRAPSAALGDVPAARPLARLATVAGCRATAPPATAARVTPHGPTPRAPPPLGAARAPLLFFSRTHRPNLLHSTPCTFDPSSSPS